MRYGDVVEVYEQLAKTSKRLEKTYLLSQFLKIIPVAEMEHVLLLVQGRIFPAWDQRVIGMATQLVVKTLALSSGAEQDVIDAIWQKTGDLGETAFQLAGKKRQATLFAQELTTKKVFDNLRKLATLEGMGVVQAKQQLVVELLTSATPLEAKYLVRTVLEDLRVGLGEGTLRDAIAWAFLTDAPYDVAKKELTLDDAQREEYAKLMGDVQYAINLTNDLATVTRTAKEQGRAGLQNITLNAQTPLKVMLYPKAQSIADAFEIVGKPAAFEYKYDGFRMQIHKKEGKVTIFTRSLEDVTAQFPEVVKLVQERIKASTFILDGEAVGFDVKTKKYVAFQNISQRIKRKYDITELAAKLPVELNLFDVISLEGKNLLQEPFSERRKILLTLLDQEPFKIRLAEQVITDNDADAEAFYQRSLAAGNEGIMVKSLSGAYVPGARVGQGVKVKPTMETLDVVIVGAEWGEGKRGQWLATFIIAVRDPDTGELLEIGRVGTGFKEKEEEAVDGGVTFQKMTDVLRPLIVSTEGRVVMVQPKLVLEIKYEEIQASPTYGSGYALRFPRFVRLREDRGPEDVHTIQDVEQLYAGQRSRGKGI
ncbi:ATP-dependent DNA ligase [Candidatus Woesearchaeota archaeon]|nr:ATP-dependent DNA ligase [Candidatus Woesearchaeota archaeon]